MQTVGVYTPVLREVSAFFSSFFLSCSDLRLLPLEFIPETALRTHVLDTILMLCRNMLSNKLPYLRGTVGLNTHVMRRNLAWSMCLVLLVVK